MREIGNATCYMQVSSGSIRLGRVAADEDVEGDKEDEEEEEHIARGTSSGSGRRGSLLSSVPRSSHPLSRIAMLSRVAFRSRAA